MEQYMGAIVVFGISFPFFLVGLSFKIHNSMKLKQTIAETEGEVIGYNLAAKPVSVPIIEYEVDGKTYKKSKFFRAVKRITVPYLKQTEAELSETNVLTIRGSHMYSDYSHIVQELYPIDSSVPVYYDPNKPKRAFIERRDSSSLLGTIFMWIGIGMMTLSVIIGILLHIYG